MPTKSPKYKFRLEHKGTTIAESDWSNILFDYLKRDTVKDVNYSVYNNITGNLAGTPSNVTPITARSKPLPKAAAKRAVAPRPRTTGTVKAK